MARVRVVRQWGRAMLAILAWFAELILEATGSVLFYRRRIPLLSFWLGFRAIADLVGMALYFSGHGHAYELEDYIQRTIQYVLVAAVSLYAAARITGEGKYRWFWPAVFSLIAAFGIAHAHAILTVSVLRLETAVGVVLSAVVAGAMGLVNGKAPEPWGKVAIGLVVLGGTDAALAFAQWHGYHTQPYYPIGAITALVILAWSAWPEKKQKELQEFRMPLPAKKPPSSVHPASVKSLDVAMQGQRWVN